MVYLPERVSRFSFCHVLSFKPLVVQLEIFTAFLSPSHQKSNYSLKKKISFDTDRLNESFGFTYLVKTQLIVGSLTL